MLRNASILLAALWGMPAMAQVESLTPTTAESSVESGSESTIDPESRGPSEARRDARDRARRMRDRGRFELDDIARRLDLTEEQRLKIMPILEAHHTSRREAFKNVTSRGENPDRETIRAEIERQAKVGEEQLATVLSEEQMEKYRSLRREMRTRREDRSRRPERPERVGRPELEERSGSEDADPPIATSTPESE